jgi:hypothetical protein
VLLVLLLGPFAGLAGAAPQIDYPTFAAQAFQETWERLDRPVYYGDASRSYTWGGKIGDGIQEPYQEGTDGQHLVQYFDKSRMEINNPDADPNDPFFVTQGLLARDMIRGEVQVGDAAFVPASQGPAQVPFGDLDDTQASSPVYASFKPVLGAPPAPAGQAITARLDRAGNVSNDPATAGYGVTSAGVIPGTPDTAPGFNQHAIADVFLAYIQQTGLVYQDGQNVMAPLYAPLQSVFGFPITEAYWATVRADGQNTTVLIQCFERRCLTYTPANDPAFRVEMANTGLQYYNWRYRQGASGPQGSWAPAGTNLLALPTALLPLPNGQVLLLGVASQGPPAVQSQRYNPATNTWSTPAPLQLPRRFGYAIAQLADGSVLVIGGIDFNNTSLTRTVASVERYDLATDHWSRVAPLLTPRSGATATLLADGRVLVAGGDPKDDFSGYTLATAELYDPARDTWTATGSMALPRLRHTATRLADGRVLVTGGIAGQTSSSAATAETELYDPATGSWSVAAPMGIPRSLHTAALLANGQVLVLGPAASPDAMAERFDPAANSWLPTAPVPAPIGDPASRNGFTLTSLPDGQALLTGGQVQVPRNTGGRYPIPTEVAATVRYDPGADRWITDAPLATPRAFHQAALLPVGRVLVVGDDQRQTGGYTVNTAEVYIPPR